MYCTCCNYRRTVWWVYLIVAGLGLVLAKYEDNGKIGTGNVTASFKMDVNVRKLYLCSLQMLRYPQHVEFWARV